ncbi:FtsQ-type POTRA domain-containing protein [Bacillota bacterium LX-D]|nr:FtsQ-type POTRA domain-containing protein [Bacillota bacterium LX-D]
MRRTKTLGRVQRKLLRFLFVLLLLTLALYFFAQSSFFNISQIETKGYSYLSSAEIKQLANIPLGMNIFKMDAQKIEKNLLLHPMVKNVKVARKLPATVVVSIQERSPAIILSSAQGFFVLDGSGVFLKKINKISDLKLPVVTGINLPNQYGPGQTIVNEKLAKALSFISKVPVEQRKTITELDINDDEHLVIYIDNGLEIRMGDETRIPEKMQIVSKITKSSTLLARKIDYIDLTAVSTPIIKYSR